MNIGIDIRSLLEKERSGVGEYTFQLLDAIFDIDKENRYFLFYNSFHKVDDLLPKEWKNLSNVYFCGFSWPNKILNFCFKFLKWPKMDGMINKNVDIFFIPNLNFIALSCVVKKIITVHDLSFLRYPKFFSRKRRLWHWFINPRKLIRGADKIIAVSENTKRDVAELCGIAPGKVEVIYSGVSNSGDFSDIGAVKKKYNLPENFILSLGTLEPRKNIQGLIRAFEIIRTNNPQLITYNLVIVGSRGWLFKKILRRAEKSPFAKDIKFINYISPEEKAAFYKLARIFIYPSFYEGFGFPPLEAAAAGTPVIVSTASSLPEIIGEAALMVDPYNPAEIAKVMTECLSNQELWQRLAEKGKAQAAKFRWERCAGDFLRLVNG